jgi:succinylarginine dihydrolase
VDLVQTLTAGNGPIREVIAVDVRQSMANGGGPACLRLRVVADPATVDPRFMVDEARLDAIADTVRTYWPEVIEPAQLASPELWSAVRVAAVPCSTCLDLSELA